MDDISTCCLTAGNSFTTTYQIERICDTCGSSSKVDDKVVLLRVPIRNTINLSIQQFFRTSSENQDATSEVELVIPPQILIVQLERFTAVGGNNFIKNTMKVSCDTEKIAKPHMRHAYKLISVIDHSGPYSNGHYTCFVQDQTSKQWFCCNDSIVNKSDISLFPNPYILFYRIDKLEV